MPLSGILPGPWFPAVAQGRQHGRAPPTCKMLVPSVRDLELQVEDVLSVFSDR